MTQSEILQQVDSATITLSKQSNIMKQLAKRGCDATFLENGKKNYQIAQKLVHELEEAERKPKEVFQILSETRNYLQQRYLKHCNLIQKNFKNTSLASTIMCPEHDVNIALDDWIKHADTFYQYALKHAEQLAAYNIPRYELQESCTLLGQMIELLALQKEAQKHVEQLIQKKVLVINKLEQWYQRLHKAALIELDNQPQQLVDLGIHC